MGKRKFGLKNFIYVLFAPISILAIGSLFAMYLKKNGVSISFNNVGILKIYLLSYLLLLFLEIIGGLLYIFFKRINLLKFKANFRERFLKKIDKWIEKIIRICGEIRRKYIDFNYNDTTLMDLAPIDDSNLTKNYIKYIEKALKNANVKNLALTGIYGSGKSSILKQFENNNNKYKVLNISLANFNGTNDEERELELEKAIVKQMFYKIKSKDAPQSRFRRIDKVNRVKAILYSLGITALVSVVKLSWIEEKINIVNSFFINYINNEYTALVISKVIILLSAGFGIYLFYKIIIFIMYKFKINKLKIFNNELDCIENSKGSSFNTYIDEIIYFFQVKKYDIVIIEDLDRFNNIEIFTKLRELNDILNSSEQINNRIVFIYAIKDDLFVENLELYKKEMDKQENVSAKNRTKFFELIIPVMPIVNSSNSYEIIKDKLINANLMNDISDEFLSRLCLYIDDMRLINNIVNEFVIYRENLLSDSNEEIIHPENLFAMIVYKNIYPVDFAKLQVNEGLLYELFNNKELLVKDIISEIDNEIDVIKEKIEKLDNSFIKIKEELLDYYLFNFRKKYSNYGEYILVENNWIHIYNITLPDFDKLLTKDTIRVGQHTDYNQRNISIETLLTANNSLIDYRKRVNEYKPNVDVKKEAYKKQLMNLKEKKQIMKSYRLSTLLNEYKLESKEYPYSELNKTKLLKYLVYNGIITENYNDYITYFYPGSLKPSDKMFLRSVYNNEPLDINYKIQGVNNIIPKLSVEDFNKRAILNSGLFYNLISQIENDENVAKFYDAFIKQLCKGEEIHKLFINSFITYWDSNWKFDTDNKAPLYDKNKKILIRSLCESGIELLNILDLESSFPDEYTTEILITLLNDLSEEAILKQNSNGLLSKYISNREDFIKLIDKENNDKIENVLEQSKIKLKKIVLDNDNIGLSEFIYRNNLYEINEDTVRNIVKPKGIRIDLLPISYTNIKKSNKQYLINYINDNMELFISNVLLMQEQIINEEEAYILELLNYDSSKLSIDTKKEIVKKVKFKIINIVEVDDVNLWSILFKNNKIQAAWDNIIAYFESFGSTEAKVIYEYLNKDEVIAQLLLCEIDELNYEDFEDFAKVILKEDSIDGKLFKKILSLLKHEFDELDFENISEEKIKDLIDNKLIKVDKETVNLIEKYYPGKLIYLLKSRIDETIKVIKELDSVELQCIKILEDKEVWVGDKIELINALDLSSYDNETMKCILQIMLNENIINEISEEIICTILENINDIDLEVKAILQLMEKQNKDSIYKYLSCLEDPYSRIDRSGKRPSIENNKLNRILADKLEEKEIISSKSISEDKIKLHLFREV